MLLTPRAIMTSQTTTAWIFISACIIFHVQEISCHCGLNGGIMELRATRQPTQNISSPNYPANYPRLSICHWALVAPSGQVVELTVTDLQVEGVRDNCSFDSLQIYDGVLSEQLNADNESIGFRPLAKLCGDNSGQHVIYHSSGPDLLVKFTSDGANERRGFLASYRAVDPVGSMPEINFANSTANPRCRGQVDLFAFGDHIENIQSPYYPSTYLANCSQTWNITANSTGYGVHAKIISLAVEPGRDCAYDSVSFYDTDMTSERLIDRLCGQLQRVTDIYSPNSNMMVHFKSDDSGQTTGFRLTYEETEWQHVAMVSHSSTLISYCGTAEASDITVTVNLGDRNITRITSPFSLLALDCGWRVQVDDGYAVRLEFYQLGSDLPPENGFAVCGNGNLSLYDGDSPDSSHVIKKFCYPPDSRYVIASSNTYYSKSRSMFIRYQADATKATFKPKLGFTVSVDAVLSSQVPNGTTFEPLEDDNSYITTAVIAAVAVVAGIGVIIGVIVFYLVRTNRCPCRKRLPLPHSDSSSAGLSDAATADTVSVRTASHTMVLTRLQPDVHHSSHGPAIDRDNSPSSSTAAHTRSASARPPAYAQPRGLPLNAQRSSNVHLSQASNPTTPPPVYSNDMRVVYPSQRSSAQGQNRQTSASSMSPTVPNYHREVYM